MYVTLKRAQPALAKAMRREETAHASHITPIMTTSDNQTARSLNEILKGALEALEEAKRKKIKADAEFEVAVAAVALLAKQLSNQHLGNDESIRRNKKGVVHVVHNNKDEKKTLGGFAIGDAVRRAKRDTARGQVVSLHPPTNRVRVQFDDKKSAGNYLPLNLRKL